MFRYLYTINAKKERCDQEKDDRVVAAKMTIQFFKTCAQEQLGEGLAVAYPYDERVTEKLAKGMKDLSELVARNENAALALSEIIRPLFLSARHDGARDTVIKMAKLAKKGKRGLVQKMKNLAYCGGI